MDATQKVLDLNANHLAAAKAIAKEMCAPPGPPGRPQCAIFLTMVQQFEASLILAQAGLTSHGVTHVRSMLETLVALTLLRESPTQVDQMQRDQAKGEQKLLKRVLTSQALTETDRTRIEQQLADCTARLKQFSHVRDIPITEKFEAAGLSGLLAPYAMFCSFAHNDLTALAFRHQGESDMAPGVSDEHAFVFMVMHLANFLLLQAAAQIGTVAHFEAGRFDYLFAVMLAMHEQMTLQGPPRGGGKAPA